MGGWEEGGEEGGEGMGGGGRGWEVGGGVERWGQVVTGGGRWRQVGVGVDSSGQVGTSRMMRWHVGGQRDTPTTHRLFRLPPSHIFNISSPNFHFSLSCLSPH